MISLQEYKNICKNKDGLKTFVEKEFCVIDLGGQDEILIEVIYKLGMIANKMIGDYCYIYNDHVRYIELIYYLIQKDSFVLAIDGMCGSGKSTIADLLHKIFDVNVFHMDDFYLPLEKRTKERLLEPGGNVDYERFIETVLKPISLKEKVYYQPFLCSCMELSCDIEIIDYKQKVIIEGSYALRPELIPFYTDIFVLKITPELQKQRLLKRNPFTIENFITKWIPLENKYFDFYNIFEKYNVIYID